MRGTEQGSVCNAPCAQLFDAGEGGDKGVGMGAADRDPKKLAGEHIGGAVETT